VAAIRDSDRHRIDFESKSLRCSVTRVVEDPLLTLIQEDRGMIISKTKTKESIKECNVSGEFYEALDKKVHEIIKTAEKRAVANGRKTVRPCDL